MPLLVENGKSFWYDEKLDTRIEYGKYIPSVIKLPTSIPEYQKNIVNTKDNTMKNTVSEINFDLYNDFINAELNSSVDWERLDKFKPIKQDGYEIIYVKDELVAYHYAMDYLKGEYLFKTAKNKPINYQKRLEKTIFIHSLIRKPITWLNELFEIVHNPENKVIFTGDGMKDHITRLVREDNMTDEQIIALLRYEISECIKLTKEFYGVIDKPESSDTKSDILDIFETLGSQTIELEITENYLIPDILPKGETIQLIADPKVGKTLFAYDLIGSIVNSEDFLGYEIKEDNKQVLLIQLDESRTTCETRLFQRIGVNYCENIKVAYNWSLSDEGLKILESSITKYKPQLVVIDSLRGALVNTDIDENNAVIGDYLLRLRNIFHKHNVSCIFIHHANKNRDNKGTSKSRGSSAIAAAFHSSWILTNGKENTIKLEIIGRCLPRVFNLELNDETLHFSVTESEDDTDSQEITDDLPITQKLMLQIPEWIKDGKDTVVLMNDGNDYNRSTLKKALNQLVKDGVIVRIGNGKNKPSSYQLVESQELVSPVSPESITEITPEYHQQYQHETTDIQPLQENITSGDTDSVTPIPNEYHQEYHQKISPDIELEKTNNETRENQQSEKSLQLTGELSKVLDTVKQALADDPESITAVELSMKYFSGCDIAKLIDKLEQLVKLGYLVKPWPDEYELAL